MAKQGWRVTAAVFGLLALAGCVLLMGVLIVAGSQDSATRAAQFLGITLAIPALAISLIRWLRRGMLPTAPTASQLGEAKETLAGIVSEQWRQEALVRSLGDPEPMPVCWGLTEPTVMDHPQLIMSEPLSLTGRSDRISALTAEFRWLRRRRLVILGGPGSGKTTLGVQLLLELLATRQPDEPIPVLVSLAGWDPAEQPRLHDWLATRIAEDYPSLRAFGPGIAHALARQGHLLPILDGLDELPTTRQPEVITAINTSLTDADQLVLTSRTAEYVAAIAEVCDVLTAAAVIKPEPLTAAQAAIYLTHCLPPDPSPAWRELVNRLHAGTAKGLATVLSTPLGLWLLRTVYISGRSDPTPLLNADGLRTPTTVEADLFDQLIYSVLAARPPSRVRSDTFRPRRTWNPNNVRTWLTYLAQYLHHAGTRDLQWWQLARDTLPSGAVALGAGVAAGVMTGLTGWLWFVHVAIPPEAAKADGLILGLAAGVAVGMAAQRWLLDEPAYANLQLRHRAKVLVNQLANGLVFGFVVGLGLALLGGLADNLYESITQWSRLPPLFWLGYWLNNALEFALLENWDIVLVFGLIFGLVDGLIRSVGLPSRTGWASTPRSTYRATRVLTVLQMSLGGLTFGLAFCLIAGLGPVDSLTFGLLIGLPFGLAFGLASVRSGAWLSHLLATCWLAASGKLPFRLMSFLDDAHRLGLLRTIGPVYQFRHAEFHDHLVRVGGTRQPPWAGADRVHHRWRTPNNETESD